MHARERAHKKAIIFNQGCDEMCTYFVIMPYFSLRIADRSLFQHVLFFRFSRLCYHFLSWLANLAMERHPTFLTSVLCVTQSWKCVGLPRNLRRRLVTFILAPCNNIPLSMLEMGRSKFSSAVRGARNNAVQRSTQSVIDQMIEIFTSSRLKALELRSTTRCICYGQAG
jgi:hypothetical protein